MSSKPIPPSEITDQAIVRQKILRTNLSNAESIPYQTTQSTTEQLTAEEQALSYNNYYEFGYNKNDPVHYAQKFNPPPWTITIEGCVKHQKQIDLKDILQLAALEERIYRFRCVEAWSMIIPWLGIPLQKLIDWAMPLASAKYIEFISFVDPQKMVGIKQKIIDYPYKEGLRLDEAIHPLTLLTVGMFGKVLSNQNGAPLRLIVPWKYGFKSTKAISKIRFLETQPQTTWNTLLPHEYGFYANVNPSVPHPRWSQAMERRIKNKHTEEYISTRLFNGYDEVAQLYREMDLNKYF